MRETFRLSFSSHACILKNNKRMILSNEETTIENKSTFCVFALCISRSKWEKTY